MSLPTLLIIGLGGFIGAVARAFSVHTINTYFHYHFAIGTIAVNIMGSLILGCLVAYFAHTQESVLMKSFFTTGVLGAFTTFSTFAVEAIFLLHNMRYFLAYTLTTMLGSLLMALLGYKLLSHFLQTS